MTLKTATRCVQFDAESDQFGAMAPPIYQTATFRQPPLPSLANMTTRAAVIQPALCWKHNSRDWKTANTPVLSRAAWRRSRR
jgi:cystathionine beta-lyase/cystathionine gamma-synthase